MGTNPTGAVILTWPRAPCVRP